MELRVLRYFLAVAREESITRAADVLHITQPTLSRQLMELEEELGSTLLIRGKRNCKISLTDDGILLRKRAEELIDLASKAEAELRSPKDLISGDVYIGGGETDGMRFIAKAAVNAHKEYPYIRYHLFSGNANEVTERLDKGLLDFGILIEPAHYEKYNHIQLPVTDSWGVLMRKDSTLAQHDTIKPKDLYDLPLLVSRQTLVKNEISDWIKKDFEKLHIVATYNLIYNASLMVDEGFGYALCLDKLIQTSDDSTLCFKALDPPLESHLAIVWKKQHSFSKASEKFLETIQHILSHS